jgi:hypothetical protein
MNTQFKKIARDIAADLGCAHVSASVRGFDVELRAVWERDCSIVGSLKLKVPAGDPVVRLTDGLFDLPDGDYEIAI